MCTCDRAALTSILSKHSLIVQPGFVRLACPHGKAGETGSPVGTINGVGRSGACSRRSSSRRTRLIWFGFPWWARLVADVLAAWGVEAEGKMGGFLDGSAVEGAEVVCGGRPGTAAFGAGACAESRRCASLTRANKGLQIQRAVLVRRLFGRGLGWGTQDGALGVYGWLRIPAREP